MTYISDEERDRIRADARRFTRLCLEKADELRKATTIITLARQSVATYGDNVIPFPIGRARRG
jgi:hypothetical protein